MFYPLTFHPIFKERVWGGRKLEQLYHKALPNGVPIGESWEISDRPGDASVIANGPFAGKDLRWLMEQHERAVLGKAASYGGRFPLLIKILDAQQVLSLQVHPPAARAKELGGEPKTEMWYFTDCGPDAVIYAGLKTGVTRAEFERRTKDGTVADCFHRLPVKPGDTMFLPSGRVHALGAGAVMFEIQQNSDTTYRVFDWNRVGLDGKPRALHIAESLASIDFNDFEPSLVKSIYSQNPAIKVRFLVDDPLFRVNACLAKRGSRFHLRVETALVIGVVKGTLHISGGGQQVTVGAGQFCLIPAALERASFQAETQVEFLQAEPL
ncbi:MAG: type I phosphomannose isomerase catalytic subunit [Verrucomicrobiota bacterium]